MWIFLTRKERCDFVSRHVFAHHACNMWEFDGHDAYPFEYKTTGCVVHTAITFMRTYYQFHDL